MIVNGKEWIEIDWLKCWALYSPDKVAIKEGESGRQYTYRECYQLSCQLAQHLASRFSISLGDRVAVLATNDIDYVILYFAVQRLGAILVPMNFRLAVPEISYIIKDCQPSMVIFETNFLSVIDAVKAEGPSSFEDWSVDGAEGLKAFLQSHHGEGLSEKKLNMAATFESPCMILYTSGTTGFPKGAVLTYKSVFWNSISTGLRLNITSNDKTVIFLPFFHTSGWNVLTMPFLHHGASVTFLRKFEASQVLRLTAAEKASLLFGVPTTMEMMARTAEFKSCDLSSVRYAIVGGEPMTIPAIETWAARGIPIRQGYGLTEFGPNVFSLNEEDAIRKIGSIGFPNFYVETKIVDEKGLEVGPNEVGELLLRGPACMAGYWNNEEATRQTIKDGWLCTGDLVRRDEEGYHFVVGRKKEMFISGGENVYPVEVEKVLYSLAGIREAAVVGVPDSQWGEVGKAFIALEKDSHLTAEDIRAHCQKNLAKYKVPKHIEFLGELPKGDSGKILKRQLLNLESSNLA